MTKLNQIIAVTNGKKSRVQGALTKAYHNLQKSELFSGISRTYHPKDEEGETLPPESKTPQDSVGTQVKGVKEELSSLFECVLTQESANCKATADVVVDGEVLLKDVPVTFLLFLEKRLIDIHTLVSKLPVLSQDSDWSFDTNKNCWTTSATRTSRTKKVKKAFEASPATKEHPAQVEVFTEDVIVGEWSKIDFSTCIPQSEKVDALNRVLRVQEAVKFAREQANSATVDKQSADGLLDYLLN